MKLAGIRPSDQDSIGRRHLGIEMIDMQDIETAYERVPKNDGTPLVIDMASLGAS